jgi:hypothetical protein
MSQPLRAPFLLHYGDAVNPNLVLDPFKTHSFPLAKAVEPLRRRAFPTKFH